MNSNLSSYISDFPKFFRVNVFSYIMGENNTKKERRRLASVRLHLIQVSSSTTEGPQRPAIFQLCFFLES